MSNGRSPERIADPDPSASAPVPVTIASGDGIGPEIMDATLPVLHAGGGEAAGARGRRSDARDDHQPRRQGLAGGIETEHLYEFDG